VQPIKEHHGEKSVIKPYLVELPDMKQMAIAEQHNYFCWRGCPTHTHSMNKGEEIL